MIVQISEATAFADAMRVVVPLKAPSAAGTILVAAVATTAVAMTGNPVALRIVDDLGGPRWRQANADAGTAYWHRIPSPMPGVSEVIVETLGARKISGRALVAEIAGLSAGDAVQALSDLLLGIA